MVLPSKGPQRPDGSERGHVEITGTTVPQTVPENDCAHRVDFWLQGVPLVLKYSE